MPDMYLKLSIIVLLAFVAQGKSTLLAQKNIDLISNFGATRYHILEKDVDFKQRGVWGQEVELGVLISNDRKKITTSHAMALSYGSYRYENFELSENTNSLLFDELGTYYDKIYSILYWFQTGLFWDRKKALELNLGLGVSIPFTAIRQIEYKVPRNDFRFRYSVGESMIAALLKPRVSINYQIPNTKVAMVATYAFQAFISPFFLHGHERFYSTLGLGLHYQIKH